MNLYPAIDLFEGKVVRLTRGDFNACTVYSDDPAEMARTWTSQGAEWLHVVDLEGAKSGRLINEASLAAIVKRVKSKIQFGGGLRTFDEIQKVLDLGISRVVLGTKAIDRLFLKQAVHRFGTLIAVGLDVRGEQIKTEGWTENGNITLEAALSLIERLGVQTLIYTDIDRDGVLQGPNLEKLQRVLTATRAQVILSGGISQLTDLEKCRSIKKENFEGIIIGKAIYEKRFSLKEAIKTIA